MSDIKVGDSFPLDPKNIGDCEAVHVFACCVLDTGHGGRHVASDGERVVEVWE